MTDFATPAAEIAITEELVRGLLHDQTPELANRPLTLLASGFDNVIYRLGEQHLVRLPRRQFAVALAHNEMRILPRIAEHLPQPIPAPLHIGIPQAEYPWPWSIVPWLEGTTAAESPLNADGAEELAVFWASLHNLDRSFYPSDATPNPWRGVPLETRVESFEANTRQLAALGEPLDEELAQLWHAARTAATSQSGCLIQGDPHGRNMLTRSGHLAAVLDWGDITWGDAASDLASLWMLISDPSARTQAIATYRAQARHADATDAFEALLLRARGWALLYGVLLRVTGLADNATHARLGREALANLLG